MGSDVNPLVGIGIFALLIGAGVTIFALPILLFAHGHPVLGVIALAADVATVVWVTVDLSRTT